MGPRLFKHKAKLRIKEKQKEKLMQKAQMKNNSNIIFHVPWQSRSIKSDDFKEAAG
jgi:hypothetical protein